MIAFSARLAGPSLGLCLAFAGLMIAAAAVQAAEVKVHRGSQVTTESADLQRQQDGGSVALQRGRAIERKAPPKAADKASRLTITAGEDIWLVDRKTGRLVGCELRGTSTVGRDRIVCTQRRLTRILR